MSAAEVIELIKKLPPEERMVVREFLASQVASAGVSGCDSAAEDRALAIGREYIVRHSKLFQKLAQ